jgi:hypothetical protein
VGRDFLPRGSGMSAANFPSGPELFELLCRGFPWLISGSAFWFEGIVTRRPLVLQLHKTGEGQEEYAQFLHNPKRRFTDFGELSLSLCPRAHTVSVSVIYS